MKHLKVGVTLFLGYGIMLLLMLGIIIGVMLSSKAQLARSEEALTLLRSSQDVDQSAVKAVSDSIDTGARTLKVIVISEFCVCIVAASALSLVGKKAILRPLKEIQSAAQNMSAGDLSTAIDYESQNEFGATCDSLRQSMSSFKEYVAKINTSFSALSEGDFDLDVSQDFHGDFSNIGVYFDAYCVKMSDLIRDIQTASEQVTLGTSQLSNAAQSLSQGTTEQAASVEQLSATLQDITGHVKDTADHAVEAKALTQKVDQSIMQSNQEMKNLLAAINEIAETSENISNIIKTIDDIAFQTNILALNASVEAARAGEAGKGFAVVADEVRNLAHRSSEAAQSTAALIENAVRSAEKGKSLAHSTSVSFAHVSENAETVVNIVTNIANAAEEQSVSINQISLGISQVSDVVQTNSATAQQSAAACEELNGQAHLLEDMAARFNLKNAPISKVQIHEEQTDANTNVNEVVSGAEQL